MNSLFNRLWASAGLANLGDGITITALPLIALAAGAAPSEVALVTVAATIAWPAFGLHAGWIVDRASPQLLLTVVNAARGISLLGLLITIAFGTDVTPPVLLTALIYGIAETLVDTSLITAIPRTVQNGQLTSANARIEATTNIANQLAGPPLAGLLIGTTGLLATSAGGALYALAAIAGFSLLIAMRQRRATVYASEPPQALHPTSPPTPSPKVGRIRDGIRFLWSHRLQRELTLMTAAMSVIWGAWTAVFVLYAVAPGPLGLSTAAYGWILAGMAVGGILSSLLIERLQGHLSSPVLLLLDTVGTLGLALPAALGAPLPVILLGVVLAGAGSTVWRIIVAVIRQQTTPPPLLGRVYSASRVISWGALPLGSGLAALAVESLEISAVFGLASICALTICLWFALRIRVIRIRIAEIKSSDPT